MEYNNSNLIYDVRHVSGYQYNQTGNRTSPVPYSMTRQSQYTVAPSMVPTSMASSTNLYNVPQPVWYPMDQSLMYPQPRPVYMQPSISQDWPQQQQPPQNIPTVFSQEPQQPISNRASSEPEQHLERNRKCRWCDRTFAHESSKCRHEKEHFNAFPCPKEGCRVVSSRKDSLKRHLRLMHGISSRKSPVIDSARPRRSTSK